MQNHKRCSELVDDNLRDRISDIEIILAARRIGEGSYEKIRGLREIANDINDTFPKKPRNGTKARGRYESNVASLESRLDELSDNELFVYKNFERADSLGGVEAFYDYGLSIDYVEWDAAQRYGDFIRWQLSWGGPSDEFQFYTTMDGQLRWTEYRYMDWFDGASIKLSGSDAELLRNIFEDLRECGVVENILKEASCAAFV